MPENMLINLSNHSSKIWPRHQLDAASHYGEILDIPFPSVDPEGDEEYITKLAEEYSELILQKLCKADLRTSAAHIMGEMTATFAIVSRLRAKGIKCIASTSERIASVAADDPMTKVSLFNFVRFREY